MDTGHVVRNVFRISCGRPRLPGAPGSRPFSGPNLGLIVSTVASRRTHTNRQSRGQFLSLTTRFNIG